MHVATIKLALCLFFCSDLRPTSSQKPRIDSIDQSELVPKARDIRQHRQVSQTLFYPYRSWQPNFQYFC